MTRAGWASTLVLTLFLVAPNALTQQKNPAAREPQGHHYVLPANKDTVQWGWLDPNEKPKLVVNSGDTVSIKPSATLSMKSSPASPWTKS